MKGKLKTAIYNIGYILLLVAFLLFITSWLWLPPLCSQLAYGDWSCAYKKCVIVKEEE